MESRTLFNLAPAPLFLQEGISMGLDSFPGKDLHILGFFRVAKGGAGTMLLFVLFQLCSREVPSINRIFNLLDCK